MPPAPRRGSRASGRRMSTSPSPRHRVHPRARASNRPSSRRALRSPPGPGSDRRCEQPRSRSKTTRSDCGDVPYEVTPATCVSAGHSTAPTRPSALSSTSARGPRAIGPGSNPRSRALQHVAGLGIPHGGIAGARDDEDVLGARDEASVRGPARRHDGVAEESARALQHAHQPRPRPRIVGPASIRLGGEERGDVALRRPQRQRGARRAPRSWRCPAARSPPARTPPPPTRRRRAAR